MSKQRIINTRFWSDTYIAELDPIEKLLFLYFITNPFTDICGVYEISLRQVALDTGIDREDMLPRLLKRFQEDRKIYYFEGWIYIPNFVKHQNSNPSVEKGIERCLEAVPSHIKQAIHSLSQPGTPNLTKLNLTKPNLTQPKGGDQINNLINLFEPINPLYEDLFSNTTERKALAHLIERVGYSKLERVINHLPEIIGQTYAPKITKPTELRRDFAKLITFVKQESNRGKKPLSVVDLNEHGDS